MTDMAAKFKREALKTARERYPDMEIVEQNWTKHYQWMDQKTLYLSEMMGLLADKKKLARCKQCGGMGKEKVIYVHEKWLKHDIDEVEWCCRKCYGVGFVRNNT